MLTQFDKALAPILTGIVIWLNQKYGMKLPAGPETIAILASFVAAVVVYFVPNKDKTT